ncbi:MAG: DUF4249 domain-containing protein [Bacteroidota bacterium]
MRRLIYSLALIVLYAGCVEPFEFSSAENEELLVIEGSITQSTGTHQIMLSRTADFGAGNAKRIPGAEVTIFDDLGGSERYVELGAGVYSLRGENVQGVPGRTYFVEIRIGDDLYRSEPETMPLVQPADSVYFRVAEETEILESGEERSDFFITIFLDSPINPEGTSSNLRWQIEEIYSFVTLPIQPFNVIFTCYIPVPADPQRIILADGEFIGSNRVDGFELFKRDIFPPEQFISRHFFNVYQISQTDRAQVYWEDIQKVANQQGTIFDPPPAPVRGNVFNVNNPDELVLGYFSAQTVDTVRTFTTPGLLEPFVVVDPCDGLDPIDLCFNCRTPQGSTLTRPSYWGD